MDISATESEDAYTLHVSGRMDTLTALEVEEPLMRAIKEHPAVVFDCEQLDYIGSFGLRVLFAGQRTALGLNHSLVLSGVTGKVREIFDITGSSNFLTIREAADRSTNVATVPTDAPASNPVQALGDVQ
jgi:anti-anti-sigma factor